MLYALRKLIAFVFLCGIFWFIYQDLGNLGKPWFMHALGVIVALFALFWLVIPTAVVRYRIHRRRTHNRERYAKWLSEGGLVNVQARSARGGKAAQLTSVGQDAKIYFHEKGTLYTDIRAAQAGHLQEGGRPVGRPSDVAFPRFRRKCRIDQRTHCYFTDSGIALAGKNLDFSIPYAGLKAFFDEPGGIVFVEDRGKDSARFAFTFQNPLIAADVLRLAKEEK